MFNLLQDAGDTRRRLCAPSGEETTGGDESGHEMQQLWPTPVNTCSYKFEFGSGRRTINWRPSAISRVTASMVVALAFCLVASVADASDESPSEAQMAIATAVVLDRMHFSHRLPDESLSGQFLENYLDAFDGSHLVFLQSDVDDFSWYKPTLSQFTLLEGYTWLAQSIHQ